MTSPGSIIFNPVLSPSSRLVAENEVGLVLFNPVLSPKSRVEPPTVEVEDTSTPSDGWRSSLGAVNSIASIGSAGSILSIGSAGSVLSIGSAGSILSIGSAGSVLSVGSIGSVASVGSGFSVGARGGWGEGHSRVLETAAGVLAVAALVAGVARR